jgi:hypothetical protein
MPLTRTAEATFTSVTFQWTTPEGRTETVSNRIGLTPAIYESGNKCVVAAWGHTSQSTDAKDWLMKQDKKFTKIFVLTGLSGRMSGTPGDSNEHLLEDCGVLLPKDTPVRPGLVLVNMIGFGASVGDIVNSLIPTDSTAPTTLILLNWCWSEGNLPRS